MDAGTTSSSVIRRVLRIRATFGAKLLLALLGTSGPLLAAALWAVRGETTAQVERTIAFAAERSRSAFAELEGLQRAQLARLASAFTESRRTAAALEAAKESGDLEWLIEMVRYELAVTRLPAALVAFADAGGEPLLVLRDGWPVTGASAASIRAAAERLIERGSAEETGYRVAGEALYAMQASMLLMGALPIGVVVLGLPVDETAVRQLAQVVGGEVCFVAEGECVVGTPAPGSELVALMEAAAAEGREMRAHVQGEEWAILADPLEEGEASGGWRVLAVPLEPVLSPFRRILRALVVAGAAALWLALGAGSLLARGLGRPVRELEAATERIARGDYTVRVEPRSRDELGRLARSFNEMAHGLELKERYRGLLDKVVSRDVAAEMLRGEIRLGGETREVTVLFADIVSFTSLTEGMEPQMVIELLNGSLGRLGEIVEEHGGFVDKYVGDGLMAVFGAPAAQPDAPARAVSAALDMQEAMARLNRLREPRGEPAIRLAIGIHTGPAVAGNMGSPQRLNYTVLGETVNLASRLCDDAGADEILISEVTAAGVGDDVVLESLGARSIRGLSRPVGVFGVRACAGDGRGGMREAGRRRIRARVGTALTLVACAAVGLSAPTPTAAQGGPDAQRPLVSWLSPSGRYQLDVSGRLDVEGYFPSSEPAWLIPETDPLVAWRLRVFADVFAGDRVYGLIELRADRGEAPRDGNVEARIEQAFVRLTPLPRHALHVQLGKFALPFGGYAGRHHTAEDPLIRPPIMYDYRTAMVRTVAPAAQNGFLDWKDDPAKRPVGAPVVWGVPYPWGALVRGGFGPVSVQAGVVSAVASSEPEAWGLDLDRFEAPGLVAGVEYRVTPELRLGASYHRGPFMEPLTQGTLPDGAELTDFTQELWGAEAVYQRGRITLRGEAMLDEWELPNLTERPRDFSYYLEGSAKLSAGLFAAARWGELRFSRLEHSVRGEEAWDRDVRRVQLGLGYRLLRSLELRGEYMSTRTLEGVDPRDDLLSVQVWWGF